MHEGHRARMMEKLRTHPESLEEHEMLEILLFNVIPRKNTNPLAHELLNEFGSIDRLFNADMDALLRVQGVGMQTASFLRSVGFFFQRYKESGKGTMPRKYDEKTFSSFLLGRFSAMDCEAVDFYFLDAQYNIVSRKVFCNNSADTVIVSPRELTQAVAQVSHRALVIAHNHVKGDANPSREDDELTKQCELLCSMNNVLLLDHFIVSGEEKTIYSYYQSGKMSQIAENYHMQNVLQREEDE